MTTAIISPEVQKSHVVKLDAGWYKPCATLNEAAVLVRNYIRLGGFGSSEWCDKTNGNVYNHDGKVVARISYNGRVWDKKGKEITDTDTPLIN